MKVLPLAAVAAAAIGVAPSGFCQTTELRAPTAKARGPQPSPAQDNGPTAVERLNKSLNPGASDPDVPLPHPDLANRSAAAADRSAGTRIYGRQEEGGGVLGLKVPIPVDRGASVGATTSGGASGPAGNAVAPR